MGWGEKEGKIDHKNVMSTAAILPQFRAHRRRALPQCRRKEAAETTHFRRNPTRRPGVSGYSAGSLRAHLSPAIGTQKGSLEK